MDDNLCKLDYAAGRAIRCREERCSLWNGGKCTVAALGEDFARDACLVAFFLGAREQLARQAPNRVFSDFHPPGLA